MMEQPQPFGVQDRRPSPGLHLELSSNNPFRNRAASPSTHSPALDTPGSVRSLGARPVSRNPFLAASEEESTVPPFGQTSGQKMAVNAQSPNNGNFASHVDELFNNMRINGPEKVENGHNTSENRRPPPPRSGTLPPPTGHKPSHSQGEGVRRDPQGRPLRPRGPPENRRPHDSPERREHRRARRNSESSVADRPTMTAEDERRRRERRRERELERERGGKPREGGSSRRTRKPHGLDTIDKLDLTGLYGSGLFHHDGPFDACNPHRNRKKDHRAPMHAFPEGSANMALGGSGPLNSKIDLDKIHGRQAEGFTDYNTTHNTTTQWNKARPGVDRSTSFDPKAKVDQVHGPETHGLGTSTFLDGAPASRLAIQRRESESEAQTTMNGGLARKKSLAQRIRGMKNEPRRDLSDGAPRVTSPDARYGVGSPSSPPFRTAQSAGGPAKINEENPFFEDYDEAYDKKGAAIKVAEESKTGRPRAPSSPMRGLGLERRTTADSMGAEQKSGGGGLLSRMKSLKGGKRARPDRTAAV